jgi:hypothetical protein
MSWTCLTWVNDAMRLRNFTVLTQVSGVLQIPRLPSSFPDRKAHKANLVARVVGWLMKPRSALPGPAAPSPQVRNNAAQHIHYSRPVSTPAYPGIHEDQGEKAWHVHDKRTDCFSLHCPD